mmetsp:Transcript_10763/g.15849  ORF Transcript_10763/g.15849 Transcript_10763/m.15849 type:complete len:175 (-) Transcript_10763:26-550(-)
MAIVTRSRRSWFSFHIPLILVVVAIVPTFSFSIISRRPTAGTLRMSSQQEHHPFCDLPGDPSLILTTNIDLGEEKMEIMKSISKVITKHTGKPETYVAVSINDNADIVFGGSSDPAALGCMYSLGAIAQESNGAITSDVTDLLEPFGLAENRIYINFFDMPRANVGWSRRTFAG